MSDALVVQLQADIASFRAGMDAAVASLAKVQESAKRTSSATSGMQQSFASAALAVKAFVVAKAVEYINELKSSFIELAEAPKQLRASLEALTGSSQRANEMMDSLYQVAKRTGAGFTDVAGLTQKLTIGLKEMGGTNEQITGITETLLKMGRIGGSSIADTAGAALQLSQALASGRLQGDELRSIMERMPTLGIAIAKEMGVSVGEIKKLGSEGKITSDIIANAILKSAQQVNAEFAKMPLTVSQATNNVRTALTKAFDNDLFAGIVQGVAERINSWVPVIEKVGDAVVKMAADFTRLREYIFGVSEGTSALGQIFETVFRMTGIALVIDLLQNYDKLRLYVTQVIPAALLQLQASWQSVTAATLGIVGAGLDKVKQLYADTLNSIIDGFNRIRSFTGATPFAQITVDLSNATVAAKELGAAAEETGRRAVDAAATAKINMAILNTELQNTTVKASEVKGATTGLFDPLKQSAGAESGAAKAVKEVKDELKAFAEQLKDKLDPMREFNRTLDQIKAAFDAGYLSVEQYRAALKMLLEEQGKAKESTDKTTESVTEFAAHAGNMFFDAIASGKDFGDVMKQLALDLAKAIFQMMVMKPLLEAISNGMKGMGGGGGGGLGGILGSIIGGIFGKSAPMTFDNAIPAPGGRIGTYAQPSVVMQTDPLGTNSQNNKEVNVVVNNYTDSSVSARRQDNGDLEIIVEKVKRSITSDFLRGGNNVASAVERAYGLQRGGAL